MFNNTIPEGISYYSINFRLSSFTLYHGVLKGSTKILRYLLDEDKEAVLNYLCSRYSSGSWEMILQYEQSKRTILCDMSDVVQQQTKLTHLSLSSDKKSPSLLLLLPPPVSPFMYSFLDRSVLPERSMISIVLHLLALDLTGTYYTKLLITKLDLLLTAVTYQRFITNRRQLSAYCMLPLLLNIKCLYISLTPDKASSILIH